MKSEHRHELKTNELADWIAHFPEWAKENRTTIAAVAVVVVVAVIVYFWSFYRRDVVSVQRQTRLTNLLTQAQQQTNEIARAAMENTDQSYVLLPIAEDLQEFARSASDADVAALALIKRAETLRAELHYRVADISAEELASQIEKARVSYQQALERNPSSPTLAAAAQFGLGLCEEELGHFEKAAEIYRQTAEKPEYAGTAAQAAAASRLQVMDDFKTQVVFKPAPPPPAPKAQAPVIQFGPRDANAPTVAPLPEDVNVGPALPEVGPGEANEAPAPVGPAVPEAGAEVNEAPVLIGPTQNTEVNKPAGG
jgi:tetratricopeptide (TPR) repeat protein